MGDAIPKGEAATGKEGTDPEARLASHPCGRGGFDLHGTPKSHVDSDGREPINTMVTLSSRLWQADQSFNPKEPARLKHRKQPTQHLRDFFL